jgi:rhodanese-related sulfurtransferase
MEFLQQNWMWASLALVSGIMLLWPVLQGSGSQALNANETTRLMNKENAVVIDVRTSDEWAKGHIVGARHIAMPTLADKIPELEKFKKRPLILCCVSGQRAASAANALKKAGFDKVFVLKGGMTSWLEAKLPVTTK